MLSLYSLALSCILASLLLVSVNLVSNYPNTSSTMFSDFDSSLLQKFLHVLPLSRSVYSSRVLYIGSKS